MQFTHEVISAWLEFILDYVNGKTLPQLSKVEKCSYTKCEVVIIQG